MNIMRCHIQGNASTLFMVSGAGGGNSKWLIARLSQCSAQSTKVRRQLCYTGFFENFPQMADPPLLGTPRSKSEFLVIFLKIYFIFFELF